MVIVLCRAGIDRGVFRYCPQLPESMQFDDLYFARTFRRVSGPTSTRANLNGSSLITSYAFNFSYTLCSVGRGAALQRTAVQESGTLTVNIHSQDIPPPTSYAPQQPTIILSQQRTSWAWEPVQ
jgi:hypothetical protein